MGAREKVVALYFTAPGKVEWREEPLAEPGKGEVLVQTIYSAISAGSERLVYRGQAPQNLPADSALASLKGKLRFPLKYGYSLVGEVVALGKDVDKAWQNRLVFVFHPHQTHLVVPVTELFPLPEEMDLKNALFFPNMETAVNLVMDGQPVVGERVVVLGQGVVGLLTTALLSRFPLESLVTFDLYELRRQVSLKFGAHQSLDPSQRIVRDRLFPLPEKGDDAIGRGADLIFEITGNPRALDLALSLCGFSSRVVIGSWYGRKKVSVNLGGEFHRNRVRIISSQVSTVAPELSGRWSKSRRFALTWKELDRIKPAVLIRHQFSYREAASAFRLLDEHPDKMLQVILSYESDS